MDGGAWWATVHGVANSWTRLSNFTFKNMSSGPITSWQIDGETVRNFIFGGYKINEDGDCIHEIKILAFWEKKL